MDSLEEAGDRLFAFTRPPQSQWKSARTTNAIERLNEEFRRRIKSNVPAPFAKSSRRIDRRYPFARHLGVASGFAKIVGG